MTSEKLKTSLESGPHSLLLAMVGTWRGSSKVWFGPGEPHDVAEIEGTLKPLMDGRFVMHEYRSSMEGKPLEGLCILGYSNANAQWQCAWIDDFHMGTGILFSEGTGPNFNALGHYTAEGQTWGWRTEITMPNTNELVMSAYNVIPEEGEMLATEIRYNRV